MVGFWQKNRESRMVNRQYVAEFLTLFYNSHQQDHWRASFTINVSPFTIHLTEEILLLIPALATSRLRVYRTNGNGSVQ
jgi:hypothetical protein